MFRVTLFVAMILSASVAFPGDTDGPQADVTEPKVEAPASKEEIERLIARLVSPNEAPGRKGPRAVYPEGYDRAAQGRVNAAFHRLYELGPKAFPYLFDHFDDKRYAMTGDGIEAAVNKSVGQLCRDIVICHVRPYGPFTRPGSRGNAGTHRQHLPSYFHEFREPKDWHEWWQTRQDKPLKEVQIEILEWIVAEEHKTPDKYSTKELEGRQQLLDKLRMSDDPLKPSWPFAR